MLMGTAREMGASSQVVACIAAAWTLTRAARSRRRVEPAGAAA